MIYECKCKPIQKLPHIVRGPAVEQYSLVLNLAKKGKVIFLVFKRISNATACDGQSVPVKKYNLFTLFGFNPNLEI